MDFDLSKENIQPLRGGRNVLQLAVALQAQTNQEYQTELVQQKEEFENSIRAYAGNDPLEKWYSYVSWVEQSYPKHGHEGNLVPLLEHCLAKFENDKRYTNDRRFCKLWIKYIDLQQNPLELYHMMYARGLCRGCADLYRAWAYYHEAVGDFQNANHVFECGKRELAQPYEELENAHKNLIMAAGQHMLYGRDERGLVEKREALTSLHTYKPGRVGSIRIPSSSGAGVLPGSVSNTRSNSNASISVYEDRGGELKGAEAPPISILTAAKRQETPKENTLKPGPWTTVPVKKRHTVQRSTPSFTVHEDNEGTPERKIFPPNTLETYSDWVVSLTLPEPKDEKLIRMYPKAQVYSEISTEFSLEEIRAMRYHSKENRFRVASAETDQAVQSILADDVVIMDQTSTKVGDGTNKASPHNTSRQSFGSFDRKPTNFSRLAYNMSTAGNETGRSCVQAAQQTFSPVINLVDDDDVQPNSTSFDIWNCPQTNAPEVSVKVAPKSALSKFAIYEQSTLGLQEQVEPKGSAMKTPFKDLNAEDLAETGSRGGMDVAAAAPVDSAKRLPLFDDDSSSPFDKVRETVTFADLSCNTQMFNFNLNAMQVSTPQTKQDQITNNCTEDSMKNTRKQLFTETRKSAVERTEKALSTILEETKSYGSSSSSSGTTTKSSLFSSHTKQNNMATISEEHNSYLAQNLKANAALRSSLLADLMDFNHEPDNSSPVETNPMITSRSSSPVHEIPLPAMVSPIDHVPSDPFSPHLINQLLQRVCFPGPHTRGYYVINNTPRLAVRKDAVNIGSDRYVIEKQLGKGTFGTVFRGADLRTGTTVALKFQKPANKWEFYICRELQSRLSDHPLRDRFMDVRIGYFSDQASILISEFIQCGSLLDVANTVKQKSGRSMKESLCMYFCSDMLKVIQAMHDVKIIHADIKPDNFLVQLAPDGTVGLQLIDFGCSIDMTLFPPGASFKRKITTEDFVCCEMIEGRSWNYHTDLFCVAATAHVLLFEKYIQLQKKDDHWSISHRLPRYLRLDLWNSFFCTLLNQQGGPADSSALQALLDESLQHKVDDFHNDMRYLLNVLKNR